jgi:hypothetical protein
MRIDEKVLGKECLSDLDTLCQTTILSAANGLDAAFPDVRLSRDGDLVNVDALDKSGTFISGFSIDVSGPKK